MNILYSPHDDDQALFAAFTCMREKPTVVICLDSYIQPRRGERGCSAEERALETEKACAILGVPVERFGLHDDDFTAQQMIDKMLSMVGKVETVYAPALEGGNPHHDLVSRAAMLVFTSRVVQYTTYRKDALWTEGNYEIQPTAKELEIKKQAMDCYESQIRVNLPHFKAVQGKSEWLVKRGRNCLHLGCGRNVIDGWTNVDRTAHPGVIVMDITERLEFSDNSFDYCFTEDTLEHLPPEKRVFIINEIHRVLEPGGMMEHFVPNAGSRNFYGSPTHLSPWNLQTFEHFDVDSYRYHKDRNFEGIIGGFKKISAEFVNWCKEEDGVLRAQSIHVKYQAVK